MTRYEPESRKIPPIIWGKVKYSLKTRNEMMPAKKGLDRSRVAHKATPRVGTEK
jgi:hypothetical protein